MKTELGSRNFDLGFRRDEARDQLPKGAAYDMVDFIPEDEAPLHKRGGWALASRDLNAVSSSSDIRAVGWVPAAGLSHLISVSDSGKLFRSSGAIDSGDGDLVSTVLNVPTQPPFWHRDREIILRGRAQDASVDPRKYSDSGGGVFMDAAVGGTPPRGRVGWSYGDYLAIANGYDPASAYALRPNRIWYSGVGNPDAWNTAPSGGFWDMPDEVVGGVTMRSSQIIFGYQKVWALVGDTPPPNSNFARRDLFGIGCMDVRSIAQWRDYVIWVNAEGIWRTDGATLTDITVEAGLVSYWRDLVDGFWESAGTGWRAVGGVLFGHYIIAVYDNTGANVGTIAINMGTFVGFRIANLKVWMLAARVSGQGTSLESGSSELFGGWSGGPRSIRLAQMWSPEFANANDGDGTAVLPVLETPYYRMGVTQEKRVARAYVNYDLRTAGGAPTLAVGHVLSPEDTAYVESGSLPVTTKLDRRGVRIAKRGEGVALRLRQTAASADTRVHEIELAGHSMEESS